MAIVLELLRYLLPSLVLLAMVYFLLRSFMKYEAGKQEAAGMQSARAVSMPLRLQAYERLILLLERLRPSALIIRNNVPGMPASDLHSRLLQNVRDEFEHNMSQQLYVSSQAWEMVRNAREETIKLINSVATQLEKDSASSELAQRILLAELDLSFNHLNQALEFIKEEARKAFF